MWETAERAGVVTANLMWYVAHLHDITIGFGLHHAFYLGLGLQQRCLERVPLTLFLGR